MPLKGMAIAGWGGSATTGGGSGVSRIAKEKYPENWYDWRGWKINIGDFAGITPGLGFPSFPVGTPTNLNRPINPESASLPKVVSIIGGGPPKGVFREDPERGLPQIKEVLSVPAAKVISAPLPQVRTSPSATAGGLANIEGDKMPSITDFLRDIFPGTSTDIFDLGAGALDIYNSYKAPGLIGPTVGTPPIVAQPAGPPSLPPTVGGGPMDGSCEPDPRNNYVLKYTCGQWKWVKKQKRRRKRLASSSDIGDLAKLKGILGMGKSMETWIATHG